MTGEKNRYKTHEQMCKLEDTELSTPKHDELVLQLLNPKNAVKFLTLLGYDENAWKYQLDGDIRHLDENWDPISNYHDRNHTSDDLDFLYMEAEETMEHDAEDMFKKVRSTTLHDFPSIKSEVPIQTGYNKFIVGYVDVSIWMTLNCLSAAKSNLFEYSNTNGTIYRRIARDLRVYNESYLNQDQILVYIEVKPTIRSFGETLRQINTYRACTEGAIYCIYSPDTHFKNAFESQGIKLITPSDLGLK